MSRTLEQLQKQYNNSSSINGPGKHRGGPGGRFQHSKGKPKDVKKTIARILKYMDGFKLRFVAVLICMLISTITTLLASYSLAPIIDKITIAINPDAYVIIDEEDSILITLPIESYSYLNIPSNVSTDSINP